MKLFVFFLFIFLSSMEMALAATLKIVSEPSEADVYVRLPQTEARIKVGRTPIEMDMDFFINNFAKESTFVLNVERDGYETYNVLVGYANKSNIDLLVNLQSSKDFVITKKFDSILETIFESQRLIRMKRYDDAVQLLDGLERDYPYLSTVYETKGSALYLKKDFNGALAYYRKAFSKNPGNMDAYSMKEYLEKSLGAEKLKP